MNKAKNKVIFYRYIFVWILAISIGCYFRLYPFFFHLTSDTSEKSTLLVLSQIRESITKQIDQQLPDLPKHKKAYLIKKRFDQFLRHKGIKVRETIDQLTQNINTDNSKNSKPRYPYLLASDSYYYFDLTENIVQTGKISDTIKGSKYLNKRMLAPQGHWEPLNLHPYLGYFIYKIIKFFHPDKTLMYAVSFAPLVITAIALIFFLFISYNLSCGSVASLIGSIFFLLAPIFIKRSSFGWYDNDPYNTFFPLIILTFLFFGFTQRHKLKQNIGFACLVAFFIILYAFFWHGWVFLFSIIFISSVIILLYNYFILKDKKSTSNLTLYLGIIHIATFIGIAITLGMKEFFTLFSEGLQALRDFLTPQLSLWPEVYLGVGELKGASLKEISTLTGGNFFLTVAFLGAIFTFIKVVRKSQDIDPSKIILLNIFLFFSILITLGAQRFALFCITPLTIFFTLGIQHTYFIIRQLFSKNPSLYKKTVLFTITSLISFIMIVLPIYRAHRSTRSLLNPIFNKTWEQALTKIKTGTPENSIINTWWPPGHFIKAIARRSVSFDGATINYPQAYWITNVFLSQDEERALGILRMLNNSANQAAEYLTNRGMKLSNVISLLYKITRLNVQDARDTLKNILPQKEIEELLKLTHKKPPPSYLLIYNELTEKNAQLTFIAKWDIKKIEEINKNPEAIKEVPKNVREHVRFLWQLFGGRPKFSEVLPQLALNNKTLIFDHDVFVNLENMTCRIASKKFGKGIPKSIFYLKDNAVIEKKLQGANLSYSVVLIEDSGKYRCILLETQIANSLLIKLFYFNGKGLKYFHPFTHASDLTRRTQIYVYKVDWDRFEKDLNQFKQATIPPNEQKFK